MFANRKNGDPKETGGKPPLTYSAACVLFTNGISKNSRVRIHIQNGTNSGDVPL